MRCEILPSTELFSDNMQHAEDRGSIPRMGIALRPTWEDGVNLTGESDALGVRDDEDARPLAGSTQASLA